MSSWNFNLAGQDDVGVAVGGGGDKTVTKTISTTHVRLQNLSDNQRVMYSIAASPSFPTDWEMIEPDSKILVAMEGSTTFHVRKKIWYRTLINQYSDPKDVQARLMVEEINWV